MIVPNYRLTQLINFIGQRKLKQVGLLACTTCTHLLENIILAAVPTPSLPRLPFLDRNYFLPYPVEDSSTMSEEEDAINTSTSLASIGSAGLPSYALIYYALDMPTHEFLGSLFDTPHEDLPIPLGPQSPFAVQTQGPLFHYSDPLGIGFSYFYPQVNNTPEAIICTECGRIYLPNPESHTLTPLPAFLSYAQQETIKGFVVDIYL